MQLLKMHLSHGPLKRLPAALLLLYTCITSLPAHAEALHDLIRYRVDTLGMLGNLNIANAQIASKTILPALYEKNQFAPLWTDTQKIAAFISVIGAVDADGLEPEDYHYSEIRGLEAYLERNDKQNNLIEADLDMLLTDGLILLVNHLIFGKVDPYELEPKWNFMRRINGRDPVAVVQEILFSNQLTPRIEELKPLKPIYAKLKTALARYRSIAAMGGWQLLPDGEKLKKGMREDRVHYLRQRLAVSGDLPSTEIKDNGFDADLETAVIQFQRRHGLDPDGIVGKKTIAALNVPVEKRIDQIRANLERARWSLHALKGRYVLVDMAGFRLFFYDKDSVVWTSRVQVDAAFEMTPVFRDEISYIEFNPSRIIPPTSFSNNILPEIKKDPGYLAKHNIKIFDQRGRSIKSDSIDWSLYPGQKFPYLLRQAQGPGNTLGPVKFMFPNPHKLCIHAALPQKPFPAETGASGSNCIRVENPLKLAELLLNDPQKWGRDNLKTLITARKTKAVYLENPVPVLLLYWTVDVDNNGIVYFKKDIYDRDKAVIKGLQARLPSSDRQ